jgi:hypothetical protein
MKNFNFMKHFTIRASHGMCKLDFDSCFDFSFVVVTGPPGEFVENCLLVDVVYVLSLH